jgi:hypothetical protein
MVIGDGSAELKDCDIGFMPLRMTWGHVASAAQDSTVVAVSAFLLSAHAVGVNRRSWSRRKRYWAWRKMLIDGLSRLYRCPDSERRWIEWPVNP